VEVFSLPWVAGTGQGGKIFTMVLEDQAVQAVEELGAVLLAHVSGSKEILVEVLRGGTVREAAADSVKRVRFPMGAPAVPL
jgi:hypothetical protein